MDYCTITITQSPDGQFVVAAPLQDKALCLDVLRDAVTVIKRTVHPLAFTKAERSLTLYASLEGRVDVSAPMPPLDWCLLAITTATKIVDEFDSAAQPITRHGMAICPPTREELSRSTWL